MKKIGIIIGSNRSNSTTLKIATLIQSQINSDSVNTKLINLAEINLPWLDEPEIPAKNNYQLESTKTWQSTVNQYDGFVIVYPQYNWGYPAVLKNALDTLYTEWQGKPVSTIVFGSHGGFQAELAMSLVLQGLHMHKLPVNLSLTVPLDAKNLTDIIASHQSDIDQLTQCFEQLD